MARATAAGLPGTWRALLSTTAVNARDRIHYRWDRLETMDGRLIATSSADLWDGTIGNPINRTERNEAIAHAWVWTGTAASGIHNTSCINWTSRAGLDTGGRGDNRHTTHDWVNVVGMHDCGSYAALYCIEQ